MKLVQPGPDTIVVGTSRGASVKQESPYPLRKFVIDVTWPQLRIPMVPINFCRMRRALWHVTVVSQLALSSGCALEQTEGDGGETLGVTRLAYSCDPGLESEPGVTYYYVAPDGSNSSSQDGSCGEPLKTLQEVESRIQNQEGISLNGGWPDGLSENSYTVYVRGGTYYETTFDTVGTQWNVAPVAGKSVKILAYPGERPVFDGAGLVGRAFELEIGQGVLTDFQMSGLTFRHYMNGVAIRGDKESDWTGGATLSDNVFEEIGCVYDQGYCDDFLEDNPDEGCFGSSLVWLGYARHNKIERNVFLRGESLDGLETFAHGSRGVMHAVYISRRSYDNTISDNYMGLISGDTFSLRDGASCNKILRNYATDSGAHAFVSCYAKSSEKTCDHGLNSGLRVDDPDNPGQTKSCGATEVADNVVTFGHPWTDSVSSRCTDPMLFINSTYGAATGVSDEGGNVFDGRRPKFEHIGGLAKGDLDGDGKDEVIVALNYGLNLQTKFSKIVASDGERPYLSRVIHAAEHSGTWRINNLVTGRFDSTGADQLVSSWTRLWPLPYRAEVWRGDGSPLTDGDNESGAKNLGRISGTDQRIVDALAAGDFDNSGQDELLVARRSTTSGTSTIFHGDATSLGSSIYSSSTWKVQAMAGGDLHGYGVDWLYAAYYSSSSDTLRIYEGGSDPNGNWTVKDTKLYEASDRIVNSLAVDYGSRLFAAFDRDSGSDRIQYSTENQPFSFALLVDPGPGISLTSLAPPTGSAAIPVYVEQSPEFNAIFDDTETMHNWLEPPATNACTGQ